MAKESDYPLNGLCKAWLRKIKLAKDFKKSHFQDDADTAMKFFNCNEELSKLLWGRDRLNYEDDDDEALPAPRFRMLIGKTAEAVQLFGPALYHRNPTIIVEPKSLDVPLDLLMTMLQQTQPEVLQQAQMQAEQSGQPFSPESLFPPEPEETQAKVAAIVLQFYLDYIQRENDKKAHSRRAIDECIIKGGGILWTEPYEPYKGGPTLIGSWYDTIDNLVIDPDAETLDEAKWIARKCLHPIWEVAEKYGLTEEFLREKYGTLKSGNRQGEEEAVSAVNNDETEAGQTNDLMEYWQVYSKMGMGHKLSGVSNLDDLEKALDSFGDNCLIVVAKKVPFPLNLNSEMIEEALTEPDEAKSAEKKDEAFLRAQWPIPFWADGEWPASVLAFHEVPNNPWPMSHMKPGLGYLEFLTWAMTFLANRLRTSCMTVASVMKSADEEIKNQLLSGKDFRLLQIPQNLVPDGDVRKAAHFLEMPQVNKDIWQVLSAVFDLFDKATGLTELAYGASGGMRSAQEASIKEGNRSVRPDDMANKVEDWLSLVARKEAMAARWLLDEEEVLPVIGRRGAALWKMYVMSGDVDNVSREYTFRIEAGSTRKPNKETRVQQMNEALKTWLPIIAPYAQQTGNIQIINAFLEDWGKTMDVETKRYRLPPPPPPQPNPEMLKAQAAIETEKVKTQLKAQEGQMKLGLEREKMDLEREKAGMEMQLERMKFGQEVELQQAEGQLKQQQLQQDMQLGGMESAMKMRMQAMQGQQQMSQSEMQNRMAMMQGAQSHQQKMQHGDDAARAKVQQTKMMAAAKPKNGKPKR